MKVTIINGSPRKTWNTAKMLESAQNGCKDAGAETKMYHLIDLKFKGCTSCFSCKRLGGPSYARCAMKDDLTQVLNDAWDSDALIIGSPVYIGDVTADMRAFLERFWFSVFMYNKENMIRAPKQLPVKIILTTNAPEFAAHKSLNEGLCRSMTSFIGPTELIEANDTLQFDDYSKYDASMFDAAEKVKHHNEVFPQDCERAYEMGKRLVGEAQNLI